MLKYPRGYSFANYEDGTFKDGGSLEDATDALANTLALLYRSSRQVGIHNFNTQGYILYNDQPPDAPENSDKAHMKGVMFFDSTQVLLYSLRRDFG